jgi:RNA polymerase sigma factor (sigma-70 family)
MSPLLLRRYRADRLLREEFETLRGRVLATVDARLRGAGAALDRSDLEAAYAQAWHGLYAAVLDGQQIVSPAAWLAVVTHRRAIDEHRVRKGTVPVTLGCGEERVPATSRPRDLADELDDRARLRTLLEALRARLSERERQAAALCYLQGLSRAEAAAQMGISESRMRKLMDGAGKGLRGVAAKVGALVQAIAAGEWCKEQGSLMRALAFGMLEPHGDRYRLARLHSEECPACRAYVLSLRGLAVALPPVPALLHRLIGGGAAGGAGASGAWAGSGHVGATASAAARSSSAQLGSGLGAGTLSASGAAGAGAAGGGWWLAGGLGAKLAAGCLIALGVGAGCVALDGQGDGIGQAVHGHARRERGRSSADATRGLAASASATPLGAQTHAAAAGQGPAEERSRQLAAVARAGREFGLERQSAGASDSTQVATGRAPGARPPAGAAMARVGASASVTGQGSEAAAPRTASSSAPAPRASAAAREFAPG